jgi:membrane protein implicated in regulation of membrane protease activity
MKKISSLIKIAFGSGVLAAAVLIVVTAAAVLIVATAQILTAGVALQQMRFGSDWIATLGVVSFILAVMILILARAVIRSDEDKKRLETAISQLTEQLQERRIPYVDGVEHLPKPAYHVIVQKLFIAVPGIRCIRLKPMSGGYSGSLVLEATIKGQEDTSPGKPYVVKLGDEKEMKDVNEKYNMYVSGLLPGYPSAKELLYWSLEGFAGVAQPLVEQWHRGMSFHEFYDSHSIAEVGQVIQDLFKCLREGFDDAPVWHGKAMECTCRPYHEYHLLHLKRHDIFRGIRRLINPAISSCSLEDGDKGSLDEVSFARDYEVLETELQKLAQDQSGISWQDPVRFISDGERWDPKSRGPIWCVKRSVVHGDLNPRNVLIETTGSYSRVWLIDFTHTGNGLSKYRTRQARECGYEVDTNHGAVLRDFSTLEASIKFLLVKLKDEEDLEKSIRLEGQLMNQGMDLPTSQSIQDEVLRDSRFQKAWECIRVIRAEARRYLCDPGDLGPFYLSLLNATLPVVYYSSEQFESPESEVLQKKYVLAASGMLCTRLP